MEKKYVVPDFIVEAILSQPLLVAECAGKGMSITQPVAREVARRVCAALAENPIVPTREQMRSISDAVNREFSDADTEMIECMEDLCIEWQRRIFLAEPEVPEEVKDLW